MEEATMEEWNKRVELKKVVDKTIESIAKKIQDNDTMPNQYPDTVRALAELVTARAALVQGNEKINEEILQNQMGSFEQILAEVPQEIKTLEVDAEKKIFKLNGIDFADSCDYFGVSCTATEGFRIRMELSKRIICANYGIDNTLKEPVTVLTKE